MIVVAGVHSIRTVKEVMVEEGSSISIPCFYESEYTDNVKYLCKGCTWWNCSYEIKTDQPNSTKYSIYDDNKQRTVTFIINDLKREDRDCYWCVMEKPIVKDDKKEFMLNVTGKGKNFEYDKLHTA